MLDPSSGGYSESQNEVTGQDSPAGPSVIPPQPYKFSTDELRVIKECNDESFYQRSLPLSTLLGFGTMIAFQRGMLKPNPRFGAFPKVTMAVMLGYFIGKISYQEKCAEKLMALPGSYIGQLLRERKRRGMGGRAETAPSPPLMYSTKPSDIYSDAGPGSSLDLDTDRPRFTDDDKYDTPYNREAETKPSSSGLTYDELRRRNRMQHAGEKQDPYKYTIEPSRVPPIVRDEAPPPRTPTNIYGDIVD